MTASEISVTLDGHCNLSFRKQKHNRYRAEETPDGIIILIPGAMIMAKRITPPKVSSLDEARQRLGFDWDEE